MKFDCKKYILVLLLLPIVSVIFAGATIAEPGVSARSNGDDVILNWQTIEETNLKHFVVQRKTKAGFMDLAEIPPEEDQYYEYIDETAYKTTASIYVYRIAIVDNGGTVTYSNEVTVHHDTINGGVKETWGSIKALFR